MALVYHIEKPRSFISPLPYLVMLRDLLHKIYGIFLKSHTFS